MSIRVRRHIAPTAAGGLNRNRMFLLGALGAFLGSWIASRTARGRLAEVGEVTPLDPVGSEETVTSILLVSFLALLIVYFYYRRPRPGRQGARPWWSRPPTLFPIALLPVRITRRSVDPDDVRRWRYQLVLGAIVHVLVANLLMAKTEGDLWLVAVSAAPVFVVVASVVVGRFWLAADGFGRMAPAYGAGEVEPPVEAIDVSPLVRARGRIRRASRLASIALLSSAILFLVSAAALAHRAFGLSSFVTVPVTVLAVALSVWWATAVPRRVRSGSTSLLAVAAAASLTFVIASLPGVDGVLTAHSGFMRGVLTAAADMLFGWAYFWLLPEFTFATFLSLVVPIVAVCWNSPSVVARLGSRTDRLCWALWLVYFLLAASALGSALLLVGARERTVTAVVVGSIVGVVFALALRETRRRDWVVSLAGERNHVGWQQSGGNRQRYRLLPARGRVIALAVLFLEALIVGLGMVLRESYRGLDAVAAADINAGIQATAMAGIVGGLLFACAARLHWWVRRLSLPSYESVRAARPDAAPLLYLRAFEDDRIRLQQSGTAQPWFARGRRGRFEIALAAQAWGLAPIIAIGEPGEKRPSAGSVREYVDDASWRDRVLARVGESSLVLFLVGPPESFERDADGLGWELTMLLKRGPQDTDLLILIPPLPEARLTERWSAFRRAAVRQGVTGLPVSQPPGAIGVLRLEADQWLFLVGRSRDEHRYGAAVEIAHARALGRRRPEPAHAVADS